MGTALVYLLVMVGVAAVVFVGAALIFGRGEELAPLPPGHTPTRLPFGDLDGDDVRALRFQQALRGYRVSEVDWVLERLATELDQTRDERAELRSRVDELERPLRSRPDEPPDAPADASEPPPSVDGAGPSAPTAVDPEQPAPTAVDPAEPSAADEPQLPAPRVEQPQRPSPAPRQLLARETEDAGER